MSRPSPGSRKIALAKKVTHPNVCRIHDLFYDLWPVSRETGISMFLTMELLEGKTLAEQLAEAGPMSWDEAVSILRQIVSGLDAAHRVGIVHRDLKPGNVMLVPDGDRVRVVITDFGLALRRGRSSRKLTVMAETAEPSSGKTRPVGTAALEGKSRDGFRWGTPDYMAPEQLRGEEVDARADIFAVGVIAHEMLTGALPDRHHDGKTPAVPKRARRLIRRCLAADADRRIASAQALLEELGGPPARRSRVRNRSLTPIAAALVLGIAAFVSRGDVPGAVAAPTSLVVTGTASVEAKRAYDEAMAEIRRAAPLVAIEHFERAVALDPNFALAWARLGEAYEMTGRQGGVQGAAEKARVLSQRAFLPSDETLQIDAILSTVENDPNRSVEIYRELSEKYPNDVEILLGYARTLRMTGAYLAASHAYKSVLEREPEYAAAVLGHARSLLHAGRVREGTARLEAILHSHRIDIDDEGSGLHHSLLGRAYLTSRNYERSIYHYERSLQYRRRAKAHRGVVVSLSNIAIAYRELGKYRQARASLTDAVASAESVGPATRSHALVNLGNLALELGDLEAAFNAYEAAMGLELNLGRRGETAVRLDAMAEVYRLMGRYPSALLCLRQALRQLDTVEDPRERAFNYVVHSHIEKARGEYALAAEGFRKSIPHIRRDQSRDIALATEGLVDIYLNQGKFSMAIGALPAADGGAPSVASVLAGSLRARVFVEVGDLDSARRELESIAKLAGTLQQTESHQFYQMARGKWLRAHGDYDASDAALALAARDARERGYVLAWAEAQLEIGRLRLDQSLPEQAAAVLEDVHSEAVRFRHLVVRAHASVELAEAYLRTDDLEKAYASATEARDLARRFDGTPTLARAHALLGQIAYENGDVRTAQREHTAAKDALAVMIDALPETYVETFTGLLPWRCLGSDVSACNAKRAQSAGGSP